MILRLQGISKNFGGLNVLQDVTFDVPAGGIFGLIGPNGAGKTTVVNLITQLLQPAAGLIEFEGRPLAGLQPHDITLLGIGRTFQNIRLFSEMSLVENVLAGMHAQLTSPVADVLFNRPAFRRRHREARERAVELLSWVGLAGKSDEPASVLSYGEQRKLELARCLATNPRLVLLDEPVAGMNSAEKVEVMQVVRDINARGYTIFMIEHDMRFVMELCQQIAVLNFGRVIAQGTSEQILGNPEVIEAYLGRDEDEAEERADHA